MAFSVNALTQAGNALLAQASAANPIVYIYAMGSTYSFTAQELAQMDDVQSSDWDITNGFIVASSATNNTARIIAGFANQATSKVMKTVAIVGRLQSQQDSDAIVVAAVSDANASIRIPSTSEPPVRIEVAINIAISDTQSVVVTSSTAGSAMLSDLDRFVSCHVPGQATTGETQYIYGAKHFEGIIYPWGVQSANMEFDTDDGNITWTAASNTEIEYINNGTYNESLRINADTAVIINAGTLVVTGDFDIQSGKVLSSLIPDGSINLGESGYEWGEIHGNDLYVTNINADSYTGGTFNGDVEMNDSLILYSTLYPNGGYDMDAAAPLTVSKCPLVCGQNTVSIGGIMLAIVTRASSGSVDSGDLIPSTYSIYKAESYSAATGGLLTPKFGAGAQLANDGSSYIALTAFQLTASNNQALVFIIRVQ